MIGPVNHFRLEIIKDDTSARLLVQASQVLNDPNYFNRFGTPKYTHYTKSNDRSPWLRVKSTEEKERDSLYSSSFFGDTMTWTTIDVEPSFGSISVDTETYRGRRVPPTPTRVSTPVSREQLEARYPTSQEQADLERRHQELVERANRSEMQRRAAQAAADAARREEETRRQRRPWDRARSFFGRD